MIPETQSQLAPDLDTTPTYFDVVLNACGDIPGGSLDVSADYTDDQGVTPDLPLIADLIFRDEFCTGTSLPQR